MKRSAAPPRRPRAPSEFPISGSATELVELDQDHPGFRDPEYRARRDTIARAALAHIEGAPLPAIEYTDAEHSVWRTVWEHLAPLHRSRASREYLGALDRLAIDRHAIPQLSEMNELLVPATGVRMLPVAGLVSARAFLERLERDIFLSTQYIRHASRPLYTPEPDVVHELVGHAATLAHPRFVELNRAFGRAALRADDQAMIGLARIYWYTVEFGLVLEEGEPKAYGAGLLSSFGELGRLEEAELRPLDLDAIADTPYDPTTYQAILFVAPSFSELLTRVSEWLGEL